MSSQNSTKRLNLPLISYRPVFIDGLEENDPKSWQKYKFNLSQKQDNEEKLKKHFKIINEINPKSQKLDQFLFSLFFSKINNSNFSNICSEFTYKKK